MTEEPNLREEDSLLDEFLLLREQGEVSSFEQWARRYPGRESALRLALSQWRQGMGVLGVGSPSVLGIALSPGKEIGDFRLIAPLGRGGQGVVWEARQVSLGRPVALKLRQWSGQDDRALALFEREARAGGRLAHPGIVVTHAHGEVDGLRWIAQELVPQGRSLRDVIDEARQTVGLSADHYRWVAELVARIADALGAAHAAGVIHRDVKPANVLITPDGLPKVTDFGLARIRDETQTETGSLAGTYLYMSPEQVAGERSRIDHRTDVFSLGVLLYELLTLRRPFEGDSNEQIRHQILTLDPPDPRRIHARCPRDLAVICAKALEKSPRNRFGSMGELAADLRRHLGAEPIEARPPSRLRKAGLWAKRHPTRSVAGVITAVAFVVLLVMLTKLQVRTEALSRKTAEAIAKSAELSHAQGLWEESLAFIAEAEQVGTVHDPGLGLLRARCLLALHRHEEARASLVALTDQDLGPLAGPVELLLGWIELGEWLVVGGARGLHDPLERVREARRAGLSPADHAIAEALLESQSTRALELYERAIELDPVSFLGNVSALQLSTLCGRFEEADRLDTICRRLYPADPSADAMRLLRARANGHEVHPQLDAALRDGLSSNLLGALQAVGDFLGAMHAEKLKSYEVLVSDTVNWNTITAGATWFEVAYSEVGEPTRKALFDAAVSRRTDSAEFLTPSVHHVGPAARLFMDLGAVLAGAAAQQGNSYLQEAQGLVDAALARHDDGWIRQVCAIIAWLRRGVGPEEQLPTFKELNVAAETPSLFDGHHYFALQPIAGIGLSVPRPPEDEPREQLLALGMEAFSRLIGDPGLPPQVLQGLVLMSKAWPRPEIRKLLLERWIERNPDDRPRALALVRAMIDSREWPAAVELCLELRKESPEDPAVLGLQSRAIEAAAAWVQSQGAATIEASAR